MGFLCTAVGLLILYKAMRLVKNVLWPFFIAKKLGKTDYLKNVHGWAVITGATDGIGKAYAVALAEKGFKVLLVSRNPEKLDAVAHELRNGVKNCAEVATLAFDFAKGDTVASYEKVQARLDELDNIGVLINNVGMAYPHPEFYLGLKPQLIRDMLFVNEFSAMMMTRIVLPKMVSQKSGVVVNISSGAALGAVPLLSLYSGTKIFLQRFTEGLRQEYSDSGVYFQNVYPHYVVTNMSGLDKATFFNKIPKDYVDEALGTIGVAAETCGCLAHCLQNELYALVPACIRAPLVKKMLLKARQRKLNKLNKEQ